MKMTETDWGVISHAIEHAATCNANDDLIVDLLRAQTKLGALRALDLLRDQAAPRRRPRKKK